MDSDQLLAHLKRLRDKIREDDSILGTQSEVCEFLRVYVGPKNSFLEAIRKLDTRSSKEYLAKHLASNLDSLIAFAKSGLAQGVSPERKAQLDVVSDFLAMANQLLETPGVHAAAPAVLIGATLEEFLRTWAEAEGLTIGSRKPGLETYSQLLRDADLISKQDGKDITSWAGVRNHAAHGEWEDVGDKKRVALMLEGVNLFMRKYSPT
jgi:hypothetical protein